ncbi:hypothetical protein [Pseudomonas sp. Gutcm_11s]|uniref:hypothetical protein n=1 Tax=Pseudomonas sp. Gutcm_11s TaxID=3026088 RepID=UPI00236071C8|nr:hypothetical protein [Pseudomonas sp. Gutcm_11s]MDD0843593.1 hypothetical protein [Pseudomonas sp. Gutcm_11s]
MFREFEHCTAWTDAMYSGAGFIGLIEYQPKRYGGEVTVLWVFDPNCICEREAENAAERMLQAILDIHPERGVLYADGVPL